MDAITRALLDEWFDQHKTDCGVDRFDVSLQRHHSHTRVVLVCPTCRGAIDGTASDTEMPTILRLLLGAVSQN
jgi:hypothetical protein